MLTIVSNIFGISHAGRRRDLHTQHHLARARDGPVYTNLSLGGGLRRRRISWACQGHSEGLTITLT